MLTYSGHSDHEEVDTIPVGQAPHTVHLVGICEIGRIAAVLQLQQSGMSASIAETMG